METLPQNQYVVIHSPLHLKNDNSVSLVFGSQSVLQESIQKDVTQIDIKLRPQNPISPKLQLDKKSTTTLLLKIHSETTNTNNSSYKAEIIGRCFTKYSTTSLCDFDYLPEKPVFTPSLNGFSPNLTLFDHPMNCMYLTSPNWSSFSQPYDYKFKNKVTDSSNSHPLSDIWFISIQTKKIPTSPPKGFQLPQMTEDISRLLELLNTLFQQHPIWCKKEIIEQTNTEFSKLRPLLPSISFMYSDGPFRQCWVRYGYDPTQHPESFIYQSIEFRLSKKPVKLNTTDTILSNTNTIDDVLPLFLNQQVTLANRFQLYTLSKDADIQAVIHKITPQTVFDSLKGFLSSTDLQVLRAALKKKIALLLQENNFNISGLFFNYSKRKLTNSKSNRSSSSLLKSQSLLSSSNSLLSQSLPALEPLTTIPLPSAPLDSFEVFTSDNEDNEEDDNLSISSDNDSLEMNIDDSEENQKKTYNSNTINHISI